MASVRNIPFEIGPGGSFQLPGGSWDWFSVAELSAGASLVARGNGFDVPLIVGRRVKPHVKITEQVQIENIGGGTVSGVLFVGSGDVSDSTVVGTVSITNADKSRTEAGQAFLLGKTLNPGATYYTNIFLVNPVGSGVNLCVNMMLFSVPAGSTGRFYLIRSTDYAALAAETGWTAVSNEDGESKYIGGDPASGQVYLSKTTNVTHTAEKILAGLDGFVTGLNKIRYTEPFIVPPGCALGVRNTTAAEQCGADFEWFEEAI